MKRTLNQDEARFEWVLNKWYEKTAYVLGVGYTVLLILAFLVGFVEGLSGN